MVKVKNLKKLRWCLHKYCTGKITQKWAAKYLGITPRRFRQVLKKYKKTGTIPKIGLNLGRPRREISDEWKDIVKLEYGKYRLNALYLEKVIYAKHKIRIPHNTIHKIMLKKGFAKRQKKKRKTGKPWIRYERKYSLSAVHMDWYDSKVNGKQVCVVLDDASRKVLSGGEFHHAITENSITVLKNAIMVTRDYYPIDAVITDHGSQFYANKRDKKGNANHEFENFLKEKGIEHILCGVNHPQTNGKYEKWNDFYKNHRERFENIQGLIEWYNNRPHGALNLRKAETPNKAFIRKMKPELWFGFATKLFGW